MWLVVISLAVVCLRAVNSCDYNDISRHHTMCFKNPGCPLMIRGLTRDEQELVMKLHNQYRMKVANGQEKRNNQPPSADMRQLEWDHELAAIAQKWAEQCKTQHDCADCRKVPRFRVGQNLYMFGSTEANETADWPMAMNEWYKEVSLFPPTKIKPFQHPGAAGHYTQLLWSRTYKVGCGWTYFQKGKWFTKLYVCNYGPAGNMLGGHMYIKGSPCSQCPEDTYCSREYPGLCASYSTGGSSAAASFNLAPSPIHSVHTLPAIPNAASPWWARPAEDLTTTTGLAKPSKVAFKANSPSTSRTSSFFRSTIRTTSTRRLPARTTSTRQPRDTTTTENVINKAAPFQRPASKKTILVCDFDSRDCSPEMVGQVPWHLQKTNTAQRNFYDVRVQPGEAGHVYFYVNDNDAGVGTSKSCLSFFYRKFPLDNAANSALSAVQVEVAVWRDSQAESFAEVLVTEDSYHWALAQATVPTYRDTYAISFHVSVPASSGYGTEYVAIDNIHMDAGPCNK